MTLLCAYISLYLSGLFSVGHWFESNEVVCRITNEGIYHGSCLGLCSNITARFFRLRFINIRMKNEISELERKYWNGMANNDYETVKNLTKFPCIVAGKQGVMSVDEPSYKKMFEQGVGRKMKIKSISDEQIEMGKDHALFAYLIELDYNGNAMKCACTSTWLKEGEKWLCAMHTESDLEKQEN